MMTGRFFLHSFHSILWLASAMLASTSIDAFAPRIASFQPASTSQQYAVFQKSVLCARRGNNEDEYDDYCDDKDKVKVPRRGGRRRRLEEDPYYYDDIASVAEDVTSGRTWREGRSDRDAYYDDERYIEEDEEDFEDDDEDYADFSYEDIDEEDRELLSDTLIPNPLLDSIDPDGAAERFPEIASDPRFWFDVVLFIAFLNFLSWAAPRDPYPDLPIDLW